MRNCSIMTKLILPSLFLLFTVFELQAQDTTSIYLTSTDVAQMKFRAKKLIETDLYQLFNNIANSENESADIATIIKNSYTKGERNQIFLHPKIIIQDDINPTNKSPANPVEHEIKTYLADLDVLYEKSNSTSIIFKNVIASNPKRGMDNSVYVKVYCNSLFRNPYTEKDKEYSTNNRVAEIRLDKEDGKWKPYIQNILFFIPEDTLQNFYLNDIPLTHQNDLSTGDSSTIASRELEIMAAEEKKEREKDEKNRSAFYDLITKGDKALEKNDFSGSRLFYNQAKEIMPNDPIIGRKIRAVILKENEINTSNEKIAQGYIRNAGNEEKKRNYQEASKLYKKAINLNPDYEIKYKAKINELDDKWLMVSQLQEKFDVGGNYKDLIEDYDKAIKQNKENSDLYYGRAKCQYLLNNLPKALKDCDLAIEKDRSNLPALKLRAELRTKNGNFFEAQSDYKVYLNNFDEDSSIYELASDLRLLIKPDDYDKAVKELQDGIDKNPKWANLHYKKGLLQYMKNEFQNAKKSFSTAISNDSSVALYYFQRGNVEIKLNNIENASLDFEKARNKHLDSVYLSNINQYAIDYYNRSMIKFKESKADSAIFLIDNALSINPSNCEYHFKKGEYLIARYKNNDAIKSLTTAVQCTQNFPDAWYKLGQAYYNLGNYTTAAMNFSQAIEFNSNHFLARKSLGDAFFALKEYNKAAQSYEGFLGIINTIKNIQDLSIIPEVYNSLGKAYFKMNETDVRAIDAFKNAIKKSPAFAEAYYNKGLFHYVQKEPADAVKDLEQAITLDGKHASWNYQLALALQDNGDFQNAANYFASTISMDSLKYFPKAQYLQGKCNYQLQFYENALSNYQKVQKAGLDSGIIQFDFELGNTYLNLTKTDSAFHYLQKIYTKDSTNENSIYALAIAQLQKGNQDEALRLFEKAFQTGKMNKKLVKNDKLLAIFKDDKRFKALMSKYF